MGFGSDGGGEKDVRMEKGCLIFLPTFGGSLVVTVMQPFVAALI